MVDARAHAQRDAAGGPPVLDGDAAGAAAPRVLDGGGGIDGLFFRLDFEAHAELAGALEFIEQLLGLRRIREV